MQVGIHFMNFTLPGGPAGLRPALGDTAKAAEDGGLRLVHVMDHWFQMEHFGRSRTTRCSRATRRSASWPAKTERIRLEPDGHRCHLPAPGSAREDRHHARRAVRRSRDARRRRRLVRARAQGPRRRRSRRSASGSSGSRRRSRSASRCGATTTGPTTASTTSSPRRSARRARSQSPRPPILIGGGGEKKTLRLVARYADACNLFATTPDEVKRKLDILAEHCENEGRDLATITKTLTARDPLSDPDAFLSLMEEYAKIGIDLVEIAPMGPDPAGYVSQLSEYVIPRLAEIG